MLLAHRELEMVVHRFALSVVHREMSQVVLHGMLAAWALDVLSAVDELVEKQMTPQECIPADHMSPSVEGLKSLDGLVVRRVVGWRAHNKSCMSRILVPPLLTQVPTAYSFGSPVREAQRQPHAEISVQGKIAPPMERIVVGG
jgi:hypothetical protein